MAETLAEKLKRLAAEKKAAQAAVPVVAEVAEVASVQPVEESVVVPETEIKKEILSMKLAQVDKEVKAEIAETTAATIQPTPSNHPLKMQFAEMEQALLTTDPSFKTILRDIHRHLGTDPDLVTQMTEEEVALVVRGFVTFANAEIVAPAKAKAVKAASKKPISADDL